MKIIRRTGVIVAVVDDEDAPTLSLAAAQDGLEAASVAVQVLVT